jgi:hypothetical protein
MSLISKNNVGAAVLLLFVVVLSQARVFDVLMNTALGRILLIAFILFLSYANKILGVVGVLFIIIMFNSSSSSFGMMEGFDSTTATANMDGSKVNMDGSKVDGSKVDGSKVDGSKVDGSKIDGSKIDGSKMNGATMDGSKMDEAAAAVAANGMKKPEKKIAVAAEGFDILGTENSIRRGKQSNSIPVRKENNMDNDVFAYDSSSIFGSFSPF